MHFAVIGANYGDEGKGLITDYLAHRFGASTVVRFNGGAQAGHTVVTPEGLRHVFSNYASGTFAGSKTRLTKDVILNPNALVMERGALRQLEGNPVEPNFQFRQRIAISMQSPISTPFEITINQLVERLRGDGRHGTCGLGINETVERHENMKTCVPNLVPHLYDPVNATEAMLWIADKHVPYRMLKLGFDQDAIKSVQRRTDEFIDGYIGTLKNAMKSWQFTEDDERISGDEVVVYEGAQGLALDPRPDLGTFPYVTRSNTGVRNALLDMQARAESGVRETLVVVYVSRAYMTRHGAGPLEWESTAESVLGYEHTDQTNGANQWQEHLRYAPLHVAKTAQNVNIDLMRNAELIAELGLQGVRVVPCMAITCMDQAGDFPLVDTWMRRVQPYAISRHFTEVENLPVIFEGWGPSRDKVTMNNSLWEKIEEGAIATI